jgi:hypothetical protein
MSYLFFEIGILGFDVGVLKKMSIRLSSTSLIKGSVATCMKDLERIINGV